MKTMKNVCQVCGKSRTSMQAFMGFTIGKGQTIHHECHKEYLRSGVGTGAEQITEEPILKRRLPL